MVIRLISMMLTKKIALLLGFCHSLSMVETKMYMGSSVLSKLTSVLVRFCGVCLEKIDERIYSVLCVSTPNFQHCCNTLRHALSKIHAHLCRDLLPLGLHMLPQLLNTGRRGLVCCELSLEVT